MLSSESTIRKLTYQNRELKTFSIKNQLNQRVKYYMVCQLRNLIYYMLAMLSYTEKVWVVRFRPLLKQMNFYQSWLGVEMPSIMVPLHIHTILIIFVACVVLMEKIFPCFNLKPDDCNLSTTILVRKRFQLNKTFILGRVWLVFFILEWV